ncbi:MAG: hypothetical protein ABSB32_00670 [Thermodesulfobacteriota bacterium]|jgi:hypothetical protein
MGRAKREDICEISCINNERVDSIRKLMHTDGVIKKLALCARRKVR